MSRFFIKGIIYLLILPVIIKLEIQLQNMIQVNIKYIGINLKNTLIVIVGFKIIEKFCPCLIF